jgi:GNAT superfamily N-acetyltransferase
MRIRIAQDRHIDEVVRLNGTLAVWEPFEWDSPSWIKRIVHIGNCYVATEASEVLGAACINRKGRDIMLSTFVVDETARGRGVGSRLFGAVKRLALDEGRAGIFVTSYVEYEAKGFYERCGMEASDVLTDQWGWQYWRFRMSLKTPVIEIPSHYHRQHLAYTPAQRSCAQTLKYARSLKSAWSRG